MNFDLTEEIVPMRMMPSGSKKPTDLGSTCPMIFGIWNEEGKELTGSTVQDSIQISTVNFNKVLLK